MITRSAALVIAATLWGCGGDSGDPEVELGTGELAFEPLEDGDEMFIVQGPQGGFHLTGSARVRNINPGDPDDLTDPDNPTVAFSAYAGDERVDLGVSIFTQGLRKGEDGTREMIGRRIILDIADDAELEGMELRVEVTVTDANNQSVSDQRLILATPHPNNL